MFTKILIANRGDDEREVHPGDFTAENKHV